MPHLPGWRFRQNPSEELAKILVAGLGSIRVTKVLHALPDVPEANEDLALQLEQLLLPAELYTDEADEQPEDEPVSPARRAVHSLVEFIPKLFPIRSLRL